MSRTHTLGLFLTAVSLTLVLPALTSWWPFLFVLLGFRIWHHFANFQVLTWKAIPSPILSPHRSLVTTPRPSTPTVLWSRAIQEGGPAVQSVWLWKWAVSIGLATWPWCIGQGSYQLTMITAQPIRCSSTAMSWKWRVSLTRPHRNRQVWRATEGSSRKTRGHTGWATDLRCCGLQ